MQKTVFLVKNQALGVWRCSIKLGIQTFLYISSLKASHLYMALSENRLNPEKPNGFADHYPYEKWLFHWEY